MQFGFLPLFAMVGKKKIDARRSLRNGLLNYDRLVVSVLFVQCELSLRSGNFTAARRSPACRARFAPFSRNSSAR